MEFGESSMRVTVSEYDALVLAKCGAVSNMGPVEISININHKNGIAGKKYP